jgi:hypothetical protein
MPDLWEYTEAIGCITDARQNVCRSLGIPFVNVFVDVLNIELCTATVSNFHKPHFFQSAAISSSVA